MWSSLQKFVSTTLCPEPETPDPGNSKLLALPPEIQTMIWHYASEHHDPRFRNTWQPSFDPDIARLNADTGIGRVPVAQTGWPIHPLLQVNQKIRDDALDPVVQHNRLLFKIFDLQNGVFDRFVQLHKDNCIKHKDNDNRDEDHPMYILYIMHWSNDPQHWEYRELFMERPRWRNMARTRGWDVIEKHTLNKMFQRLWREKVVSAGICGMFVWSLMHWLRHRPAR